MPADERKYITQDETCRPPAPPGALDSRILYGARDLLGDAPLADTSRRMTERAGEDARLWLTRGGGGGPGDEGLAARWSTTLSSKVNLPRAINLRTLCGANLVTQHPGTQPQRNRRTLPCEVTGGTSARGRWIRTSSSFGGGRWIRTSGSFGGGRSGPRPTRTGTPP